ncbi:MAG: oligosaccharide flippase family protein, partial [Chloroflexi bacterium]|nr:oligosaccharide flippase family protein [Chloroflexota bacterium]
MTRSLSRNTALLALSNVGGAGLSFVLAALIGRVLGDDGLGVYAAVLAWIFPLNVVVEFGLGTLMTRDLAQQPADTARYLRTAARARLIIGGGVLVLIIAGAPLLSTDPRVIAGLRISAPLVIVLPLFSSFSAILRAHDVMWPLPPLNLGMLAAQVALTSLI